MTMRITADTRVCIGSGMCVLTSPEVFDQDVEDGTVVLLNAEPDPEHEAAAREAVELCPSRALSIG